MTTTNYTIIKNNGKIKTNVYQRLSVEILFMWNLT